MTATTEFTRADYNRVMAAIANGALLGEAGKQYDTDAEIITVEDYEAATAFAKAKKTKRPGLIDEATPFEIKAPKIRVRETSGDAAKAKAPKTPKTCGEADCAGAHYSKGLCSRHYAAARRQDPVEREKANEASKAYYARQRAAAVKAS